MGDIAKIVDVPTSCPFIGLLEERTEIRRRPFHASTRRHQSGEEIPREPPRGCALGTIIWAPRDDAHALDRGRPGPPELHRHEGTGRDARDRTLLYAGIVGA